MRLIDADELMNELMKVRWAYQMLDDTWAADKAMGGLRAAEQKVKDAPTVDAAPVVRCKDCKYFHGEYTHCAFNIVVPADYFFCLHGQRKAEP